MKICVYGAASPTIDDNFKKKVYEFGREMVKRGHSLVFGGGGNGLMGAVADGVKAENGYILGVIPDFFEDEYVEKICDFCNELMMPETMRERKQLMEDNSDAFVVTPGGIGTYEEFFEILTLKQLCRHSKPIAIYNIDGYYDELISTMQSAVKKNFIKESVNDLYFVSDDPDKIFEYLQAPVKEIKNVKELKDG